MPQPWPQPAPRIVKLPALAETAESAWAGIVVKTADVPITATATAPLSTRLMQLRARVTAGVGEGAMAVRSWGSGLSLQHVSSDTQVKKRDSCY